MGFNRYASNRSNWGIHSGTHQNGLSYPRTVPIDRGIKIWRDEEGNLKSSALGLDAYDIRLLQSMKEGDTLDIIQNPGEDFCRLYRPMNRRGRV